MLINLVLNNTSIVLCYLYCTPLWHADNYYSKCPAIYFVFIVYSYVPFVFIIFCFIFKCSTVPLYLNAILGNRMCTYCECERETMPMGCWLCWQYNELFIHFDYYYFDYGSGEAPRLIIHSVCVPL